MIRVGQHPFKTFWIIFSNISGVIGLASLADTVIAWKGFILEAISLYQSLIHPLFIWMFQWFPYTVPQYVYDYLFFGILITTCHLKALHDYRKKLSFKIGPHAELDMVIIFIFIPYLIRVLGGILVWPIVVINFLRELEFKKWDEADEVKKSSDFINSITRIQALDELNCFAHKSVEFDKICKTEFIDKYIRDNYQKEMERHILYTRNHRLEPQAFFQWLGLMVLFFFILVVINLTI